MGPNLSDFRCECLDRFWIVLISLKKQTKIFLSIHLVKIQRDKFVDSSEFRLALIGYMCRIRKSKLIFNLNPVWKCL